jgi:hypothetical protein
MPAKYLENDEGIAALLCRAVSRCCRLRRLRNRGAGIPVPFRSLPLQNNGKSVNLVIHVGFPHGMENAIHLFVRKLPRGPTFPMRLPWILLCLSLLFSAPAARTAEPWDAPFAGNPKAIVEAANKVPIPDSQVVEPQILGLGCLRPRSTNSMV